jgi:hypothetical protein
MRNILKRAIAFFPKKKGFNFLKIVAIVETRADKRILRFAEIYIILK